jgi:glycosyltransferase involved in cell wall biosynthesis
MRVVAGQLPVEVIPNGADHIKFTNIPREAARAQLGISPEEKVVLFVGGLVPIKGVEYLIDALPRVRDDRAVLYCVGDGESRASLEARAKAQGVWNRCKFVGFRPYNEMPIWLSAANCLVLPSRSEGLPTIILEAMMCRLLVIATPVGGVPEVVKDGKNGFLVPVGNSQALAERIQVVLAKEKELVTVIDRAEAETRRRYTWQVNAEAMMKLYRGMIDERSRCTNKLSVR